MSWLRFIPAIIFTLLFVVFLLPLSVPIFNLGNAAGAVISGLMALVFFLWTPFTRLIGGIWQHTGGRIFLCAAGGLAAVLLVVVCVISGFMIHEMNDSPDGAETTVVILGCQVRDGGPSYMLRRRLEAAYGYLSQNEDVPVIVSGGQGEDEAISEAQCMRDYLVGKGISPDRIYMEDRSADTEENLRFSKRVAAENGLPGDITIVTDGFHQLRADMLARQEGLRAYNISARTPAWLLPTYWVREWFGVAFYAVFGGK
ncbi:MAG: YdcF family protein [Ruminococcus sp.]|nr:YdcF family protein [Ruminococcus sp.]